jgi:Family of unknown function (DUF5947)
MDFQAMASRNRNSISALRQFIRETPKAAVAQRCELCSTEISPSRHRHLLEIAVRQVRCVCDPCALRFQDVVGGKYKLIPRDVRPLPGFQISDAQWENLSIPINLAFFYTSSSANKLVAMYPSPAGATESLLALETWESFAGENVTLAQMEADVEALLVNRVGTAREYYLVPIDVCYQLVGLIRVHWRGLSGGEVVWQEIEQFFASLRPKSTSVDK